MKAATQVICHNFLKIIFVLICYIRNQSSYFEVFFFLRTETFVTISVFQVACGTAG